MHSSRTLFIRSLVVVSLICGGIQTRADVFHLTEGGEIVGQLVERGEKGEYVIKPQLGGTITLAKKQVAEVERQSEFQPEYESRSRALPDTVAAHRAMADWCKQQKFDAEALHHMKRILELDPNDEQVRTSMGFQFHQGKWLTRDEIMAERGMFFYDGTYRTAQDIALRKRDSAHVNAEVEWLRKLKLWRDWLDSRRPEHVDEAQASIQAITDPQAATSVVRMMDIERDEDFRYMWMEIMSQIRHPATMRKLIQLSLDEPDRETRLQCIDYLLGMNDEIEISPYIKALNSNDNVTVNIAAEALGAIGNPDAISPLIDALVTRHKVPLPQQPSMSASFSPDGTGGGGLSAGSAPQFEFKEFENPAVHQALIKLSGDQEHGYEKTAWRRWFVNSQSQPDMIDTRRDQ